MAQQDKDRVTEGLARHGHVSYLEIPAADIETSATFYEAVFGWQVRRGRPGSASFDDGTGSVIGRWDTALPVAHEPGLLPYIYVERIEEIVEHIVKHGGRMVKTPYPEGNLYVATFRDPAGNVLGIWQAGNR